MSKTLEGMARAARRQKFERTRRLNSLDQTLPSTSEELGEMRAALEYLRDNVTEEMVEAMIRASLEPPHPADKRVGEFQAAINAALNEEVG